MCRGRLHKPSHAPVSLISHTCPHALNGLTYTSGGDESFCLSLLSVGIKCNGERVRRVGWRVADRASNPPDAHQASGNRHSAPAPTLTRPPPGPSLDPAQAGIMTRRPCSVFSRLSTRTGWANRGPPPHPPPLPCTLAGHTSHLTPRTPHPTAHTPHHITGSAHHRVPSAWGKS